MTIYLYIFCSFMKYIIKHFYYDLWYVDQLVVACFIQIYLQLLVVDDMVQYYASVLDRAMKFVSSSFMWLNFCLRICKNWSSIVYQSSICIGRVTYIIRIVNFHPNSFTGFLFKNMKILFIVSKLRIFSGKFNIFRRKNCITI